MYAPGSVVSRNVSQQVYSVPDVSKMEIETTRNLYLLSINLVPTYSLILNNTYRCTIKFYVKCNSQ